MTWWVFKVEKSVGFFKSVPSDGGKFSFTSSFHIANVGTKHWKTKMAVRTWIAIHHFLV